MDEIVSSESSGGFIPRKLSALLTDSWNLCISNASLLVKIVLVVHIPLAVLNFYFLSRLGCRSCQFGMRPVEPVFMQTHWPLFILFIIVTVVLALLCSNALYRALDYLARGERIEPGEAYSQGFRLILPAIWIYILYVLVIIGGLILLIVPGVIFAIWFCLSYPALIVDNARGRGALKVSRAVVRPHIGKVFGNLIVISLIVFIVSMLLIFLISIVGKVIDLTIPKLTIIVEIIKGCAGPIIGIWSASFLILLYRDLREVERPAVEKVLRPEGYLENSRVPPSLS